MLRPVLFLLPCALIGATADAATSQEDIAAAILAANHRATGEPGSGFISLRYAYSGSGMTGTVTTIFDSGNGAFIGSNTIGPAASGGGFDGKTAWQKDISGTVTPEEGGDRPALGINQAYRNANLWWRGDRGGAAIAFLGRDADGDHLGVTPTGGKAFDAWFDAKSHLLVRLHEMHGFSAKDWHFSEFSRHDGVMRAGKVVIDEGHGPDQLQTETLIAAGTAGSVDFTMPAGMPADYRIKDGAASVSVPFRLLNNHIFIDATVDGKGPFPFLLDTGGHDILTNPTANSLQLASAGSVASAGAGEKTAQAGFVKVHQIDVGGASLTDQTILTLDFSPVEVEGFQVGGMLGFELFRRFVVSIDYGAGLLTITDPARFDPGNAGTAVPFRFYDHMPQIEGRIDGRPARFDIDTGARNEVTLSKPFVDANALRQAYADGTMALDGWGVGGPSFAFVTRTRSLSLGSVTVSHPLAALASQNRGVFTDANFDGNIGSGLLKRFVATFDYAHQILYLKPVAKPDIDIGTFDHAGLWLNLGTTGFEIAYLVEGAPAQQAGLATGDAIVAIGDHAAADLTLSDARRLFRIQPAGTRLAVTYLRKGERRTAELMLRDLVPPA